MFTSIVGWDHLSQRLEKKDPFETRRDLTDASMAMVQARPLLGFGMGNWATVYPSFARVDDGRYANQAHNDWLQTAAEGGFIALAALLAFAAGLLRPAFRSLWGIGVVAMLVHGLVDYPLQKPILMAWLMVLSAAMLAAERSGSGVSP